MPFIPSDQSPAAPSEVVKDVTPANLKADVIDASKKALVLMVFWTPRDRACKELAAALEKVARASAESVRVARIDIDRDQTIAQQMGVQSVPSVFAFYQARPVDAFSGGMTEAQLKTWVDQVLKTTGAGGGDKAEIESSLKQAADFRAAKDIDAARSIYTEILAMNPENGAAYAGLVRCLLEENELKEAHVFLDAAPAPVLKDKALDSVRAALELAEQAASAGSETGALEAALKQNPDDHQARFDLALAYYGAGKREEAVELLLDLVRRSRTWNEGAARKQLVKFFEAMGNTDPLTVSARKRLSSLLFS